MTASIRDVADRAGVSVGTVSNVLNHRERVAADLVDRVRAAIDELGYVRNDAARQLRAGRSSTVGMIVLDIRNPFFADVGRGAEREADRHGLSVVVGSSDQQPEREARLLDLFEQQRSRGVLISPVGEPADRLRRLRLRGIPAVLVDRSSDDPTFSSVSVNDERGGMIAVAHLTASGRHRIAFAGGPESLRQVADRLRGARQAALAGGAVLETIETAGLAVTDGRAAGDAIAAREPVDRPDAVFAGNDLVALGVLQSFAAHGIRVPVDIALVGFDDIDFAAAAAVPLSSVRQPAEVMGETALRLLVGEGDDPGTAPRQVVFEPELVVRASSGVGVGVSSAQP